VPESLKNILLVMADGGYLVPPDHKAEDNKIWEETWRRLDRFLPNLFAEVFPEQAQKPRADVTPQADQKEAAQEIPTQFSG